jgi:hypothetical protein
MVDMSANETSAELRARLSTLAAAATERPWRSQLDRGHWSDIALIPEENVPPLRIVSDNPSQLAKHDAAFIVALVNAWPTIDALLAENVKLREAALLFRENFPTWWIENAPELYDALFDDR